MEQSLKLSRGERLKILISAIWLILIAGVSFMDFRFNWPLFLIVGMIPVVIVLGFCWVKNGL